MEKIQKDQKKKPVTSQKRFLNATQRYNIQIITDILKKRGNVTLVMLEDIIRDVTSIVQSQPNTLKLSTPVTIVGDIHGQFYDLLNIFQKFGKPINTKYLFLGDYVDRGKFCIQVITLILVLKIMYPKNFYLLRGNHEGRTMTTFFNFKLECEKKYNSDVYESFIDLFTKFPLCAIIDNKYFAVHGGLSPNAKTVQQINKIVRFNQIPDQGALCDLLWSDPSDESNQTWVSNKLRSCSYFYSRSQSSKFLGLNGLRMIIRGHQVQMKGFKYQYSPTNQPLTLTIFSAPRYCDTYKNKGAVAVLNGKTMWIRSFKDVQHPFVLNNYLNAFQLSFPIIAQGVTKVYAHMLKSQSLKPLTATQIAEMKKAIQSIDILQSIFNIHAQQIQNIVVSSKPEEQQQEQVDESIAQNIFLQLFLQIKSNDFAQKMPTIFGPKGIQFVKVSISHEQQSPDCTSQQ